MSLFPKLKPTTFLLTYNATICLGPREVERACKHPKTIPRRGSTNWKWIELKRKRSKWHSNKVSFISVLCICYTYSKKISFFLQKAILDNLVRMDLYRTNIKSILKKLGEMQNAPLFSKESIKLSYGKCKRAPIEVEHLDFLQWVIEVRDLKFLTQDDLPSPPPAARPINSSPTQPPTSPSATSPAATPHNYSLHKE